MRERREEERVGMETMKERETNRTGAMIERERRREGAHPSFVDISASKDLNKRLISSVHLGGFHRLGP